MRFTLATTLVSLAALAVAAPSSAGRNGIAIPITKRFTFLNADKSVNFTALKSHLLSVEAKVLRGFENFERNTGSVHPSAVKGVGKRGAGIPLTDENNNIYWQGAISIGTPPEPFTVNFDTGSSDLFIPGSTCGSSCNGHARWNPKSSSTSNDLHKNFSTSFGDGSTVSGEQYTDVVSLAGFTACEQTLGVANIYSSGFTIASNYTADGLLGMAFQTISRYNASPVFQSLVSQGQVPVKDARFSFKLSSSGAELYIGGANPDLYTGNFTFTPVTRQAYWEVILDEVRSDGRTILRNLNAIIDTGTTLIVGPPPSVSAFYSAVGGSLSNVTDSSNVTSGLYTFPCDRFPTISLTFSGKSFPIPASALNLGPVSNGSSQCVSGIVGVHALHKVWIVGDVFLRNVYTVFDLANSAVGFADLA